MEIHLIWAQDFHGGIGSNNQLPWHIKEDLKNFKKLTSHNTIIMGYNTWESIQKKPLPNRRNIVITSKQLNDIEYYNSFEDCLDTLKNSNLEKVFIIGGSSMYKYFFSHAHYLHITIVDIINNDIDVYFPFNMDVIKNQFKLVDSNQLSDVAIYSLWKTK